MPAINLVNNLIVNDQDTLLSLKTRSSSILKTEKPKDKYELITLNDNNSIPNIALGTWKMANEEAVRSVKEAVGHGYRHIDCAWRYNNEKAVGQALKELFDEKVVRREDLFITSKAWNTFHGRELIVEAIKESLNNLGLQYLDLFLIHFPTGFKSGTGEAYPKDANGVIIPSKADLIETWKGMEDAVKLGLAKSIGVSNFNVNQLSRVLRNATIKPVVNQVEIHPFLTQLDLVKYCQTNNVVVEAYSPLGQGDKDLLESPVLREIGQKYDKSAAQVVLRWLLERGIVVITKSVRQKRLIENMDVLDFQLTNEEINRINRMNRNKRMNELAVTKTHPEYPFKA